MKTSSAFFAAAVFGCVLAFSSTVNGQTVAGLIGQRHANLSIFTESLRDRNISNGYGGSVGLNVPMTSFLDFTAGGSFGDEDLDFGVRLLERARVEFNPDTVSHQRYVVTPSRCMEQWRDAGRADVAFARKHPSRARELFRLHGAERPLHRLVWMPKLHRCSRSVQKKRLGTYLTTIANPHLTGLFVWVNGEFNPCRRSLCRAGPGTTF